VYSAELIGGEGIGVGGGCNMIFALRGIVRLGRWPAAYQPPRVRCRPRPRRTQPGNGVGVAHLLLAVQWTLVFQLFLLRPAR
jgi:hypothetical protein